MALETSVPERFSSEVFEFMQLLSNRIAVAIDNANLHQQVQKQLDALKENHDKITQLEQLKTDMIRIAAHDLNNPLGAIKLNLSILKRLATEEQMDKMIMLSERIEQASEKMERITQDILSLERIEQLANEANVLLPMDVKAQVEEVVTGVGDFARQKSITVQMDIDGSDTLYIQGDSTQIHEAMTNLVHNAIKYTPVGGEVRVNLTNETDRIMFMVVDNGYGIPKDRQERLFQPFYRVKTSETEEILGTGLGLHIVKNIVERHKGEIIFESVAGEGSTFGFWLPSAS